MSETTISLDEETHERLRRAKREDEDVNDAVERLLAEAEHPLYKLVGLADEDEIEWVRKQSRSFRADTLNR